MWLFSLFVLFSLSPLDEHACRCEKLLSGGHNGMILSLVAVGDKMWSGRDRGRDREREREERES